MVMTAEWQSMKAIAAELCLGTTTIVAGRNRLLEKMNQVSSTDIVRYVVGLI